MSVLSAPGEAPLSVNRLVPPALLWLGIATVGVVVFFWDGFLSLGSAWTRPEYSYGPMVPLITAYLTLREIHHRPVTANDDSRLPGFWLVIAGLLVGGVGNAAKIPDFVTYGFIILVGGFVLILAGYRQGLRFWPGWVHLFFMLPLPQVVYLHVSTYLQHVSSKLGVAFIDLMSVPVYLDGNIIDLGIYKLQVAEACSGLRYLFPLFSFGWMIAVLYNGPNWHRVVIFLSTIPITILMNSFRIGMIGLLVNEYGIGQAEGFLHFFEGWVIFISCTAILYIEAWFLQRFLSGSKKYASVLSLDTQGILGPLRQVKYLPSSRTLFAASLAVVCAATLWAFQSDKSGIQVPRQSFDAFPSRLGEWQGRPEFLDQETRDVLGADDYLLVTYAAKQGDVNLLLTFYNSQTEGSGIHSPQVCIPAGGWEVSQWEQKAIRLAGATPQTLTVNRAIIQKGMERQLVYYWFEQRGTRTTNDFNAKLLAIRDTVLEGRSDGGLVRVITPIAEGGIPAAEARLGTFLERVLPQLPRYFPASLESTLL